MKVHTSVIEERVLEACNRAATTLDNPGICLACGEDVEGCEPDAVYYECDECGKRTVFGAENILLRGLYYSTGGKS